MDSVKRQSMLIFFQYKIEIQSILVECVLLLFLKVYEFVR